jgi:leucyl/phenylalanyl-tRNA--protein transferase
VTVYRLADALAFPSPEEAEPDGLLAVGGDLRPERLLLAYSMGIFPWQGSPPLWFSPDPRWVLQPERLRLDRSARRALRRDGFELRMDSAFEEVIGACARTERADQDGTWITPDILDAYVQMHRLGFGHSVEAWEGGELVGGIYGLSLGGAFFGESMFSWRDDASKLALIGLVDQLHAWGFDLLDCQVHTEHVERLGAEPWPRAHFLTRLQRSLARPTRRGRWRFDGDPLALRRAAPEPG